jgi:predicted small lipoprotein YifL
MRSKGGGTPSPRALAEERRPMIRTALLLALAGSIVGCGDAEPPRFVPATGTTSGPAVKAIPDNATRETTPSKNIATH